MKNLGAYDAFNLDGGGSTVMWIGPRRPAYCEAALDVGGCVANRPSDGNERTAIMSLAVLPGGDPQDPT